MGKKGRMGGPGGKGSGAQKLGAEPNMIPKGVGSFGRTPSTLKDGDPLTKPSPYKKPGVNSFF